MDIDVRLYPALASLALVPVALFLFGRGEPIVALSLVSVVIIAWSIYVLFTGEGPGLRRPA